jgi:NodT family efflux transporter outer membrane factor (OMF) lipoprotein
LDLKKLSLNFQFATRLLPLGFAWLFSACMVGPNFTQPEARIQGKWRQFEGGSDREIAASEVQWWRQLRDPQLNSLVEEAYRNNPSLQAAGVRIYSARAELNHAVGNLFPQQQDLQVSAGSFSPTDSAGPVSVFGGQQNILASQAILSATWEIDFWGKYRRQIQSDRARYLSSIAAYDSALVSLIADVVNTYVNIRVTQDRIRIARENVILLRRNAEMAEARMQAGQVPGLDVAQAATQLASNEAAIPLLQDSLDRQINALAVLLGEPPQEAQARFRSGGKIPTPPGRVDVGIPHDLLRRRPDVRQAGLVAASQSAKIGVEFAELLPSFSLTGSFGYGTGRNYTSFSNIFNWQQSVADSAGSLVVPILNYGRIINQVRVQDAAFQQAVMNYQNTVLRAQREVEDAISTYVQSRNRLTHLQSAVDNAEKAVKLALAQYEAGATNYTTVIAAEQARMENRDALAVTRGQALVALVSLYRALGGGWEIRETAGVISPEVRQQMADRTNWGRLLDGVPRVPVTP